MSKVDNKFYPMEVVCAWCDIHLYWAYSEKSGQVSHGICDSCKKDLKTELMAVRLAKKEAFKC